MVFWLVWALVSLSFYALGKFNAGGLRDVMLRREIRIWTNVKYNFTKLGRFYIGAS